MLLQAAGSEPSGARALPPPPNGRVPMTYYSGFVLAVPAANKGAYVEMARQAWPMLPISVM